MNLRHSTNRIASPMLALFFGASLLGLCARSVSAQSITVTTPFPFCVNKQAYPSGTYRFTPISEWLVSIHNVNGTDESFFVARPDPDGPRASAIGPAENVGGLKFQTLNGIRELVAVYVPSADASLELSGPNPRKDNSTTHRSLSQRACLSRSPEFTYETATAH
jgi:hypothetical protein